MPMPQGLWIRLFDPDVNPHKAGIRLDDRFEKLLITLGKGIPGGQPVLPGRVKATHFPGFDLFDSVVGARMPSPFRCI